MRALPYTITLILESRVALNRVSKFLTAEEVKLEYIKPNEESSEIAIKMRNGSFYWLSEEEKKLKKEKEEEEKLTEEEKKKKKKQEAKEQKEKKKREKQEAKEKKKRVAQSNSTSKASLVVTSYNPQSLERQRLPESKPELEVLPNGDSDVASMLTSESTGYRLVLEDVNLEIKKGSFVAILEE